MQPRHTRRMQRAAHAAHAAHLAAGRTGRAAGSLQGMVQVCAPASGTAVQSAARRSAVARPTTCTLTRLPSQLSALNRKQACVLLPLIRPPPTPCSLPALAASSSGSGGTGRTIGIGFGVAARGAHRHAICEPGGESTIVSEQSFGVAPTAKLPVRGGRCAESAARTSRGVARRRRAAWGRVVRWRWVRLLVGRWVASHADWACTHTAAAWQRGQQHTHAGRSSSRYRGSRANGERQLPAVGDCRTVPAAARLLLSQRRPSLCAAIQRAADSWEPRQRDPQQQEVDLPCQAQRRLPAL